MKKAQGKKKSLKRIVGTIFKFVLVIVLFYIFAVIETKIADDKYPVLESNKSVASYRWGYFYDKFYQSTDKDLEFQQHVRLDEPESDQLYVPNGGYDQSHAKNFIASLILQINDSWLSFGLNCVMAVLYLIPFFLVLAAVGFMVIITCRIISCKKKGIRLRMIDIAKFSMIMTIADEKQLVYRTEGQEVVIRGFSSLHNSWYEKTFSQNDLEEIKKLAESHRYKMIAVEDYVKVRKEGEESEKTNESKPTEILTIYFADDDECTWIMETVVTDRQYIIDRIHDFDSCEGLIVIEDNEGPISIRSDLIRCMALTWA